MPTVMPWTKRDTSPLEAPNDSSASDTAFMTPSDWSEGVVGDLPVTSRSRPSSTASVKVPPTSTPRIIGVDARCKRTAGHATASSTSSRWRCEAQYLLPGCGMRRHAVPLRVLA